MRIPNLKADLIAQFKTDKSKLIALAIVTTGGCVLGICTVVSIAMLRHVA